MLNIDNLSVRKKLSLPLSLVMILIIVVSIVSLQNSRFLAKNTQVLSSVYTEAISTSLNADRDLYQAHAALLEFMLNDLLGAGNTNVYLKVYEENAVQAKDRMEKVRSLISDSPALLGVLRTFDSDYKNWLSFNDRVIAMVNNGDVAAASSLYQREGSPLFEQLRTNYDKIGEAVKNRSDEITKEGLASNSSQMVVLGIAILLAIAACLVSLIIGPQLITNRINTMRKMLSSISEGEGDLTQRLSTAGNDEITRVAEEFNNFIENLQGLISIIKKDAISLSEAKVTLAQTSQSTCQLSQSQSDNLDQVATAVNELSQALREVAENTQVSLAETKSTNNDAIESKDALTKSMQSITTMESTISHSSKVIEKLASETSRISSLLNVIRDIAEQTNLLALNAAIEAARAGEQGRGFAVVADEVRSLANRTQQATSDINAMLLNLNKGVDEAVEAIEKGASQVTDVVALSNSLSDTLIKVSESVSNTTDRIYQIAAATEEQSQVVDAVNNNISSLNVLTLDVVRTVEAANSASENVNAVSNNLMANVGRFTV
ncbi:MAG: hypothetical protein AXW14_05135 [Alteromonas sp. Nap_26]|nr:MAG: hypothetical protein AXW14_05135 [Alteromonas sp. Nap_26]